MKFLAKVLGTPSPCSGGRKGLARNSELPQGSLDRDAHARFFPAAADAALPAAAVHVRWGFRSLSRTGVAPSPGWRRRLSRGLSGASPPCAPARFPRQAPAGKGSRLRPSPSASLSLPQAVCVKEVAPELQSCQLLPGVPSIIQCKADVTVSLDPADCSAT